MTDGHEQQMPPAPPTTPQPLAETPSRAQWPKVLGIIGIVMGAFGILSNLQALFVPPQGMVAGRPTASMPGAVPEALQPWIRGLAVIGLLLAGWLLAAGIGLLRRRGWSARALLLWAGMKAAVVVAATILVSRIVVAGTASQMASTPMSPSMMNVMVFAGSCVGLVFGLAIPVFVLIWFNREKVKNEVANWS